MHVVVVGGGITGMFSSYYLLKSGHSVTIVDKPSREFASLYNAGFITPSLAAAVPWTMATIALTTLGPRGPLYVSPKEVLRNVGWFLVALRKGIKSFDKVMIDIGAKSLELHKEFLRDSKIDVDLINGVMALYKDSNQAEKTARLLKGRYVDGKEIFEMGFLRFEAGVYFAEEFSINPSKLFNGLRDKVSEMGAKIMVGNDSRLLKEDGEFASIIVDGMKVRGDNYVITAGAWSGDLCKNLGYNPHILPARGLAMIFETGGTNVAECPAIFEDYGIALSQHNKNQMRITSFFELTGYRKNFGEPRKKWLLDIASKHLARYGNLKFAEEGTGYRPCTPDQLPVIGRVPGFQNLYIASGNCREGVTLAPVTGYIIRTMINGEANSDVTVNSFDPARFS